MADKRKAGRPVGSVSKTTLAAKELAQRHGSAAVETLAKIMQKSKNEGNRISAAREILDRGYGKPTQAVSGDADAPPIEYVISFKRSKDGPQTTDGKA